MKTAIRPVLRLLLLAGGLSAAQADAAAILHAGAVAEATSRANPQAQRSARHRLGLAGLLLAPAGLLAWATGRRGTERPPRRSAAADRLLERGRRRLERTLRRRARRAARGAHRDPRERSDGVKLALVLLTVLGVGLGIWLLVSLLMALAQVSVFSLLFWPLLLLL